MSKSIPVKVVDDGAMYASAAKIYPRETDGRLQRLRTAAVFWLLGMFYVFPWLSWGDRQMVLFDLPARKFYIFGLSFWPQDFFYLSMLLMMAAFSLFFFTALAGRLWCGYACPQTVWTEVFLWMERWTEGSRNQRMKLDAAPWTRDKILRKSAKQFLWVTFALWTGFTFVGFFTPIRELAHGVLSAQLGGWEIFWILFYGLATYGNAGYLREQVCKYMCPYARFQGAMFDRNTLIIAYDEKRGEQRGARRKGVPSVLSRTASESTSADAPSPIAARAPANESVVSEEISPTKESTAPDDSRTKDALAPSSRGGGGGAGDTPVAGASPHQQIAHSMQSPSAPLALGDCIDCTICVQVCPTGIDIRNGLQYECIACGACVDACDAVMDKMDYPRGLIRYSTLNAITGKPSRVLRPRIVIYASILLLLVLTFSWSVLHRVPLIVDVLRDRNALYRIADDGSVENSYTIKVMNKDQHAHRYRIKIDSDLALSIASGQDSFEAGAEEVVEIPLTLRAAPGTAKGAHEIEIEVQSETDHDIEYEQETRFFGPF
jgi:polyferredoxin